MQGTHFNIIDSSSEPLMVLKGSKVLDCNKPALSLFGYKDKKALLAVNLSSLLVPQQPDGVHGLQKILYFLEQVMKEGVGKEVIFCKKADGKKFLVDLQAFSLQLEDGELVFQTRWKETKPALDQRSSIMPAGVVLEKEEGLGLLCIGEKGEILSANKNLCLLLNYEEEELKTHCTLFDLLAPEDPTEVKEKLLPYWISSASQLLKKKKAHSLTFLSKEQQPVVLKAQCLMLNSSKIQEKVYQLVLKHPQLEAFSANEKSTSLLEMESLKLENKNLKRVQKLLKRSLERLKVLAECSPDIIMQFDRSHRHLFVNSQAEAQTGFKVEEFLGKTHEEMGFPPALCAQCREALDKVYASGKSGRVELCLPNGSWMDWILIPEFNSKGEVNSIISTARNITEQKKTQSKLAKSEQRLRDAFEVTQLSSWEYDVKTDQILLSHNWNKLVGIDLAEAKSLSGNEFLNRFVLKEDRGKFRFLAETALKEGTEEFKEVIDYRISRPNGEIVHILGSVRLEIGDNGKVSKAYGTSQDITYLRLTEQELEEYRTSLERLVETRTQELKRSEAKLADALRLANLGTWEYDPVIESFLVSEEVMEIIGTTSEIENGLALSVARCKEIIYPEDYAHYRETVLKATEYTDEYYTDQTEIRIRRSDGDIRHIYLSIKVSKAGKNLRFFGTIQDITAIRRTESEKIRLNEIIETTSDIVGIAHIDGSIAYLNKAGKDFFGLQEEEELARKTFYSFQPINSPRVITEKELRHAELHGTWSGMNQYMRYDGLEVPVSQVIISHKNAEGQVQSYSTIIRDISQQKRIEQDLIFKNNELDTFVYRASHDLRGPIATLMGLYNLVQYEVKEKSALALFEMYNSQVMRLNTITLTLIELTKIKEREYKPSVINMNKLVQSIFNQLQEKAESKDMLFTRDIEEIKGFVSDERLLMVVLYNLIENAIKYKRKEVTSFVRVEVKRKADSDRLVIKVSDNGIGIDSAIQPKIYNMFFRGNERSSGSGLGLYILKNAVEKLGGRVHLYSVLYKGTTFKIELPPIWNSGKE